MAKTRSIDFKFNLSTLPIVVRITLSARPFSYNSDILPESRYQYIKYDLCHLVCATAFMFDIGEHDFQAENPKFRLVYFLPTPDILPSKSSRYINTVIELASLELPKAGVLIPKPLLVKLQPRPLIMIKIVLR